MLELQQLTKHYELGSGEPIRAVDGVSLRVSTGTFVAMYGPSGSGKTTLLELIAGLRTPDSGRVVVDGRDLATLSRGELETYRRKTLGIIGQTQSLIPGALAIENAALKLWLTDPRHAEVKLYPLFRELGLTSRARTHVEQLSGGERQRVLIARALVTRPRLVLADEPTGNLDSKRTSEVLALLRRECSERDATLVLATHDPQAADFADEVYTLRDGVLHPCAPSFAPAPSLAVHRR